LFFAALDGDVQVGNDNGLITDQACEERLPRKRLWPDILARKRGFAMAPLYERPIDMRCNVPDMGEFFILS
jgi:hypothetical protein